MSLDTFFFGLCLDEPEGEGAHQEHGMSVVFNGRMNERVKAGTAAVRELHGAGVPVYIGN
jgi:cytosine/adenosine deaminase-related metal-dependent hydrolase